MPEYPFKRPLIPNGCRRAHWHNYRSRCIYLITINAAPGMPRFSNLSGIPGDRQWPPRTVLTPTGEIIAANLSALKSEFPFIRIPRRVIMPEHIHFVLNVTENTDHHLGIIIHHLKAACTSSYIAGLPPESIPPHFSLFEDLYHDRILMKAGQLQNMLNYVSANPRRRLERMVFPEFNRHRLVSDPLGNEYEIYGNLQLLENPDIEAVRISRKFSPEELRKHKLNWKRTVENCGVLASPFISKDEKAVRDWAMENGSRLITIQDNGFGPRFSPKGKMHDLCTEGRLLMIAPKHFSTSKPQLDRAACMEMNALAARIAAGELCLR